MIKIYFYSKAIKVNCYAVVYDEESAFCIVSSLIKNEKYTVKVPTDANGKDLKLPWVEAFKRRGLLL